MAALSGPDSNHSSVNSIAVIARLRTTRNMSRRPSRRSFHASAASGRPSVRHATCAMRGMLVA